jgi:hypothetical protein
MRALGIAATLLVTGSALAATDLVIPLKFIPTTKPGEVTAQLRDGVSSRSVAIEVEDARGMKSVDLVGEGTADNDSMFKIRSTGHVPSFVKATLRDRLAAWGAVVDDKSQLVLAIRASRFYVRESNMVIGSAYQAEVQLPWVLRDRAGHVFAEGAAGWKRPAEGAQAQRGELRRGPLERLRAGASQLANNASLQEPGSRRSRRPAARPSPPRRTSPASSAGKTPRSLLKEVNKLRSQQFGTNVLVAYVSKQNAWRWVLGRGPSRVEEGGGAEPVMQAALKRAP